MLRGGQMLGRLQGLAARPLSYPVILFFIGLIAYLYSACSLGYYWDDWEVVFLLNARDPALLTGYFAFDRPFAWPYQAMYAVFGLSSIAWHVVTFMLRWGGVLLLYYSLQGIWPRQQTMLKWWGVLVLVYPGFLQQSISGAYNRHFTAFFVFALSVFFMVLSTRGTRTAWIATLAAWLTAFIQIFTIEYFVGLELIRPLLLWLLVTGAPNVTRSTAARRVALTALPYMLLLVLYSWWRLVVFPSTIPIANYAADVKFLVDFQASLGSGLLAVLTRALMDLLYATTQVWLLIVGDASAWTLESKIAWFALGIGALLSAVFAFFYSSRVASNSGQQQPPRSMALAGLWAFLVSAVPIWLTSRQLSAEGRWDDRFTLAPMLGACLLVIWAVAALVQSRKRAAVLAVLLALSITTQILVVNRYRLDWAVQNTYYWQLHWRAPALQPGTAIISLEQPSASIPGYDASFAMNLLFRGLPDDGVVPYWFFTNDRFLNFELKPGQPILYKDRNLKFVGNSSDAISVIRQGERRCLQVLDADYAAQPFYAQGHAQLVEVSNVSRILPHTEGSPPSRDVFGPEPEHTWCYYFQKADLARQYGDWQTILDLERQARSGSYVPGFGPELLPFIEAHAQAGDWEQALSISEDAQLLGRDMDPLLCATWERLSALPRADAAAVDAARQEFACSS